MLVHQHSDSLIGSRNSNKAKRRRMLRKMPLSQKSSPLLLISSGSKSTSDLTILEDVEERRSSDQETLEIKELCESPRSVSRHSMFSFNPTPESSPEQQRRQQSMDSPQALSSSAKDEPLSDDSSLSSPDSTPSQFHHHTPVLTERRRYMVINEMLTTETKYIDNLNTILTIFLPAFEHVVAARDLRLLIPGQLEMLMESHQQIRNTLKQRLDRESQMYGCVGDIFSSLCENSNLEFFTMYSVYMGEFKVAMRTLANYETESAQFKEILRLLQQSPLCERLSLASYLLTPIQRLPRYELLLKELLKHTPINHPDHLSVGGALTQLHAELTKLNLSIKSCQLACPVSKKNSIKAKGGKRPRRTLSMLKKFVSTANIDDYSSGDSSFTTDDLKLPGIKLPRRFRTTPKYNDSAFMGSEHNLSSSAGAGPAAGMFRRGTLTSNRAVSCSDLRFEPSDKKKKESPMKFQLMTPLNSAPCTPNSSRHSSMTFSSSNSSLSSLASSSSPIDMATTEDRDGSVTPTAAVGDDSDPSHRLHPPVHSSTPISAAGDADSADSDSRDNTLKLKDRHRCERGGGPRSIHDDANDSDQEEVGEEEEGQCDGDMAEREMEKSVSPSENVVMARKPRKSGWRISIFKKKRKSVIENKEAAVQQ